MQEGQQSVDLVNFILLKEKLPYNSHNTDVQDV